MARDDEAAAQHQAAATRLRAEIEELVKQAKLLLHGEPRPDSAKQKAPPPIARRAERDKELEDALEKVDVHRREIKRIRQELETRDHVAGVPNADSRDHDPMELQNRLSQKKKELRRLQKSRDGLEKIAEAQMKAEEKQNALRPEVKEKLKKAKNEVNEQKQRNAKLQADRLKLFNARKAAEEEMRAAGAQLKSAAAQLQRPPKGGGAAGGANSGADAGSKTPAGGGGGAAGGVEQQRLLRKLQQDIDILKEAVRQDERKFKAAQKEDTQEIEFTTGHIATLKGNIAEQELKVSVLQAQVQQLHQGGPSPSGQAQSAAQAAAEAAVLGELGANGGGEAPSVLAVLTSAAGEDELQ